MIGLKRREKLEGWAIDITDSGEMGRAPIRQRLADNNKLWIVALAAVLFVACCLVVAFGRSERVGDRFEVQPPAATSDFPWGDSAHRSFSDKLLADRQYEGMIQDAGFISPSVFKIVVSSNTSADDIEYISKMAATKILHEFRHHYTVKVYTKSGSTGPEVLAASTSWKAERYGFAVDMKISQEK